MLKDVIINSGLHPSRIFNATIFGSQVYGTINKNSDFDIIIVANNSVESIEISNNNFNIHIYTPDKFKEDLEWHRINNLECIFAPDWAKLKEDIKYDFDLNLPKLRHAISHISSNSWVKCKKKIEQGDYYIGIKSLFHSLRIPIFGTQIAKYGHIYDFTSTNYIYQKIMSKRWNWEEIDLEFREERNKILIEFRKSANKF